MIRFEVSVDDGCQLDTRIGKLCLKYKIPCTFYIPIDYMTMALQNGYEPLTQKSYRWLIDNFEIGSHGVTHRYLTKIDPEEAKDEIFASKKMLENLIDRKVTKFCYPRGYANDQIKQWVKEAGYTHARSTAIGNIQGPTDDFFAETTVHMGCPVRPEYEGTTWLDYATEKYRECLEGDGNYIFHVWGHSWEIDRYNEWKNVETLFKLIGEPTWKR